MCVVSLVRFWSDHWSDNIQVVGPLNVQDFFELKYFKVKKADQLIVMYNKVF